MVVEEKPADRFPEMVRLNRLIRSFDIAIDLLVVSDEKFQYWRETPGNVKRREQALLFLRKAAQDEASLDAVIKSDK